MQEKRYNLKLELILSLKYPNKHFISDIRYNYINKNITIEIDRKKRLIFNVSDNLVKCLNDNENYSWFNEVIVKISDFFESYKELLTIENSNIMSNY